MGIYLICPVRKKKKNWLKRFFEWIGILTDKEKQEQEAIKKWVNMMENHDCKVHWPPRDTNQIDPIGLRICEDHAKEILKNKTTMVWWDEESKGSHFDFGMSFMLAVLGKMLRNGELTLKELGELLNGRYGRLILTVDSKKPKRTPHKSFNNVLLEIDKRHGVL